MSVALCNAMMAKSYSFTNPTTVSTVEQLTSQFIPLRSARSLQLFHFFFCLLLGINMNLGDLKLSHARMRSAD